MEESKIKKIYEILNNIPVTEKNKDIIEEIREELLNKDIINYESITGMSLLEIFNKEGKYFEDKIYNK